jgi:hypothetical protein
MKTKPKAFGRDWTDGELKFPEHLTPKTIHSALFIYNAKSAEETTQRVEHCAKEIGDKAMSYAMAMLMLPTLMNSMAQSEEYITWNEQRIKTLH